MVELDWVLLLALFIIPMMIVMGYVNDWVFIYYQHLALPAMLPFP